MIRETYERQEGWEFPFVMYRPSKMEGKLPVIIQLHGAGERGDGEKDLDLVEVHGFRAVFSKEKEYPCMLVLPQCPKESFWAAEIPTLYAFIRKLIRKLPVNDKKISLTGLSMGGYGTWYFAMRHPKLLAAIAPVCGGGMVWNAEMLDMPVWAFHGTEDDVVYPSETIQMIHKIRAIGSVPPEDVNMTLIDKVGHNAWDYAYTEELLEWLLEKERGWTKG